MAASYTLDNPPPSFKYDNGSFADNASDLFLRTSRVKQKNMINLMNYQNAYNTWATSTQYQRSKQDMLKAGINPMVMFANGGGGAKNSTATSAGAPIIENGYGTAIGNAIRRQQKKAEDVGKLIAKLLA